MREILVEGRRAFRGAAVLQCFLHLCVALARDDVTCCDGGEVTQ